MGLLARVGVLSRTVALSSGMLDVLQRVDRYARARTSVTFVGATGVGKSFFAQALHEETGRTGRFVDVTAHELARDITLSQLFGHVAGAFTDAKRAHTGYFAEAERGTLLLDDFHLLDVAQQATLLRALERGVYRPVGAERDVPVACRLAFGVGAELDTLVDEGRMLLDLRSRLGFSIVRIPPLAERREEIPLLAMRFLEQAPDDTGVEGGPTGFAPEAVEALSAHCYRGNVRELRELVRESYLHAVHAGSAVLGAEHLDASVSVAMRCSRQKNSEENQRAMEWALKVEKGNVARAAARVRASPHTVRNIKRAHFSK